MKTYLKNLFVLLCIFNITSFAQNKTIDSLNTLLKNAKLDTVKINVLSQLSELCEVEDILKYAEPSIKLCEEGISNTSSKELKYFYSKKLANAFNNIAFHALAVGNSKKALEFDTKSLNLYEELGDKSNVAITLNNIGGIYENNGDIPKAIEYYSRCLKLSEQNNEKIAVTTVLNNLAIIYLNQNETEKALDYFFRNLKIQEELNDLNGVATTLNNIGSTYTTIGDLEKSLDYLSKSLVAHQKNNNKMMIGNTLVNIGEIYKRRGNDTEALKNYTEALSLQEKIGYKKGIANTLAKIGAVYEQQKDYKYALNYFLESMKLSKELGFPESIKTCALHLNQIYKATNNFKSALENYELYILMNDSINNQQTRKASIKSQLKYEYEKKAAADSVKVAEEKKLTSIKLKQEQTQRYFLYVGLSLTALFGIFMFNRFRVTKKQKSVIEKQKQIVEHQKHIVDEKQKEILDSIRYAKRIQQSLLPSEKYFTKNINKHRNDM